MMDLKMIPLLLMWRQRTAAGSNSPLQCYIQSDQYHRQLEGSLGGAGSEVTVAMCEL